MLKLKFKPTVKEVKLFSIIWFPLMFLIFGFFFARTGVNFEIIKVAWMILAIFSISGFIYPSIIRPFYVILLVLTFPVGWIVSHTLLLLIFVILITPIGLVLRIRGHNPLNLNSKGAQSMWVKCVKNNKSSDYLKQY